MEELAQEALDAIGLRARTKQTPTPKRNEPEFNEPEFTEPEFYKEGGRESERKSLEPKRLITMLASLLFL